jgi:hypothetical protein
MDNSLDLLWRMLPVTVREQASLRTDARARKAAEHNAVGALAFNIETDQAFVGYVRRRQDYQPYSQWAEVLLAGIFQAKFFQAVSWVGGQLIHAATSVPMDLRQFRPGTEPRWKWHESERFARGRPRDTGRRAYDQLLAGHDVVGLLGHLSSVFFDGGLELRRDLRSAESSTARPQGS